MGVMMKIIGLAGRAGTGKDTLAGYLDIEEYVCSKL